MARRCSTICLPICEDDYLRIIGSPARFRLRVDQASRNAPELFPEAFARGYTPKDFRTSGRPGIRTRRIRPKATERAFSVRPRFASPSMTGLTDRVEGPLSLRAFGVPFRAPARVSGRGPMYWYRLDAGPGRNGIAGTTRRRAELPEHLPADEHHRARDGQENYIATAAGAGCRLGAALAQAAGTDDRQRAYGAFGRGARDRQEDYQPETVSTDGRTSTRRAWLGLFPRVVIPRCFPRGWLATRDRGKSGEGFAALAEEVWDAYHAPDRGSFARRLRRLWGWAERQVRTAWVLGQVKKVCGPAREYGEAYGHEGGHRTTNMLDRVMRGMGRYSEGSRPLHGGGGAGERHCRARASLPNFRPWNPATARANGGWRSPAERVNEHRYHDDWLHNLLVSASLAGFRR